MTSVPRYILVNIRFITAMVDISAIYNFISVEEIRRLSLILKKRELYMKAMNFEVKLICRVACDVATKIESWSENVNFLVV